MNSRAIQTARNSGFLLGGEIATRLGGVALLVLLARRFGPEGFGSYSAALALGSLLVVIADPGLAVLTTRDIARSPDQAARRLQLGLSLKVPLSVAMVGAAMVASHLLSYPIQTTQLVLAVAVGLAVGSFATFIRAVFRAFEQMHRDASTRIAEQAIVVGAGLSLIACGYPLLTVAWSVAAGKIAGLVLTLAVCGKEIATPRLSIDMRGQASLLASALPLALAGILDGVVFYTDSVMLSAMKGSTAVGLYAAAQRPLAATLVLPAVLAAALLPQMSRDSRSAPIAMATALNHSLKLVAALALPLAAFVVPTAAGWLTLVFGSQYASASQTMGLLAGAVGMVYVVTLTGHALVAADRQMVHLKLAAMCAALNVALNLLLIPRLGLSGAALASLVSQAFMLLMELRALRDLVDLRRLATPILKLAIASSALFAVAQIMTATLEPTSAQLLLLITPVSAGVYVTSLIVLRVLDRGEVAAACALFRWLLPRGR